MASRYHEETLKIVVSQLCQNIGFQGILSSSLDVLVDLLHRYLKDITISTHRYTEHYGRTVPTLEDLDLALNEMGVSVRELEEYITFVEPINFPHKVPKLPVPRTSNLNFLKPGAREILSRPLHIHEHLPPMYPEKEEEHVSNLNDEDVKEEVSNDAQASPQEKRPAEEDASPNKKVKWTEEEGEPVREIDSVMMTTSGYISSAREGKMPEARRPLIPLSLSGGGSCISKSPSSMIKKKATMEKIIRHKNHQGGILPGPLAKPKVKHVKLKPKIPLAPPGTGSLKHMRSPGSGQAPKLKIPNINKEKDVNSVKKSSLEKEERKRKEKKEGREKKRKDREDGGARKRKEDRREYKYHFYDRKERTRIRMRGLSKEEELRRYKERENELIAALAASSAVTVTSIPPPSLKVREKTPDTPPPLESSPKNKLSVFRKFPKLGSKEGGSDSSPDLMIDAPVVKEEKLSPPPSPTMDIPDMQEEIPTNLPPTPRTPEMLHHFPMLSEDQMISPHKIKKEKDSEKPKKKSPRSNKRRGSSSFSPSRRGVPEFGNVNRPHTPEGNLIGIPGDISEGSPLFTLPPFQHGPSLIPPPFPRFPFIPPFGAPTHPTVHDINPISRMFMENSVFPVDKEPENFENIDPPPSLPPPPVTSFEYRARNVSPVAPHMHCNLETKIHIAEKSVLHSPPKAPIQEPPVAQPAAKTEKPDKEKKKEHKKEKKDKEKEKLKKKKEKKEREKREKEEKKKEKKEEKERLKKERKEKKKTSSSEGVPKITLKLPTEIEGDVQTPPSEVKVMPKLVIKPVLKHPVREEPPSQPVEKPRKKKNIPPPPPPPLPPPSLSPIRVPSPSPPHSLPPQHSPPVSPTFSSPIKSPVKITHHESPGSPPEIAKFSALVTRPPKGKKNRPFPVIRFQELYVTRSHEQFRSSKKSGELSVPPLKIKDSGYKISSKKDLSGSIKIESKEKETTVPPLKIKNSSSSMMNSSSKFAEDKKSSHSKKSEKKEKEKRKTSPLIITSLSNIDTGGSAPVPSVCPPQPPPPQPPPAVSTIQLPPPIHTAPEIPQSKVVKKTSGVGTAPSVSSSGPQNKSVSKSSGLLTETMGPIGHFVDDQGNEVWICPTCGKQDDGSPMIGCDTCDDWYHWVCVGIHVPPSERENWYCPRCLSQHKQQRGNLVEKKKRGRKRKII